MNEDIITNQPEDTEGAPSFWDRHRLSLLLVLAVSVALVLTVVSVTMYTLSDAIQLDLSRPGYKSVSSQIEEDKSTEYSAFGAVNKETIKEFLTLYDDQATRAKAVDAFNGDPLNPELLQFAPAAQ